MKSEMKPGQCAMCLQQANLLDSHFIPRSAYPRLRNANAKSPHPIMVGPGRTVQSGQQISCSLFCATCEDRLNKNGEAYTMRLCAGGTEPLLKKLHAATPIMERSNFKIFSGAALEIDTEKIAYFAVSVLWRAAIRQWVVPHGLGVTNHIDLGTFQEPIRRYLVGEGSMPANIVVNVTVCSDSSSQRVFTVPSRVPDNPNCAFGFGLLGLMFRICLCPVEPEKMKCISCTEPPARALFMADQSEKIVEAFARLQETTKLSFKLEERLKKKYW